MKRLLTLFLLGTALASAGPRSFNPSAMWRGTLVGFFDQILSGILRSNGGSSGTGGGGSPAYIAGSGFTHGSASDGPPFTTYTLSTTYNMHAGATFVFVGMVQHSCTGFGPWSFSDTAGNSITFTSISQSFLCTVYGYVNSVAGNASETIQFHDAGGTGDNYLFTMAQASGVTALDQSCIATSLTGCSSTTTVANEIIFSLLTDYGAASPTVTAGTGFTLDAATYAGGSFGIVGTEYQVVSTTGTYTGAWNDNSASGNFGIVQWTFH